MGLFDNVVGALQGNANGAAASVSPQLGGVLANLLQQHGGIAGLLSVLTQGGLGQQAASWVGSGQNLAVTAEQIIAALGHGSVGQVAQQMGVNTQQAGGLLAQVLPHLIDHLTPNGQVPAAGAVHTPDILSGALSAILGRRN